MRENNRPLENLSEYAIFLFALWDIFKDCNTH